jgi:hypothetical protein
MKSKYKLGGVIETNKQTETLVILNIIFKHPVALIYLDTQYNSIKNATTRITPSSHDMFWLQTAIFRYLSYAKTVPLSTYSHHM